MRNVRKVRATRVTIAQDDDEDDGDEDYEEARVGWKRAREERQEEAPFVESTMTVAQLEARNSSA